MTRAATRLCLLVATGCGRMAVDGQVVDPEGRPVADARVTLEGTPCAATSGEDGRFSVECSPGTYQVYIAKDGHTTTTTSIEAPERDRYQIGEQRIVQVPAEAGLFLLSGGAYQPLLPGQLERSLDERGGGKTRAYCVDTDQSQRNNAPPGPLSLYDSGHPGWRVFRLDDDGCAYRDVQDADGRWQVVYKEKPEVAEENLQGGLTVTTVELAPGHYFLADWTRGFFTPTEDEKTRYTGAWRAVGG